MIRDSYSKAILETDIQELQRYRMDKKRDRELQLLRQEVNSLSECINRLYETVTKLESKQ